MIKLLPDNLPHRLQAIDQYWREKCRDLARLPRLSEIDMMEIYLHAPYIFMADRQAGEGGVPIYQWRYWGTAIRDFTGIEATGKSLHETHDMDATREAEVSFGVVLQTGKPEYWKRAVRTVAIDRSFLTYERVIYPLLNKFDEPVHIFGVFTADNESDLPMRIGEFLADGKIGYSDGC